MWYGSARVSRLVAHGRKDNLLCPSLGTVLVLGIEKPGVAGLGIQLGFCLALCHTIYVA